MLIIAKLLAASTIAIAILNPSLEGKRLTPLGLPQADSCECKAKAANHFILPHAETCECKAKKTP